MSVDPDADDNANHFPYGDEDANTDDHPDADEDGHPINHQNANQNRHSDINASCPAARFRPRFTTLNQKGAGTSRLLLGG